MISCPKRRQVGTAGLVLRFRDGTCTHACRRCGQWETFSRWRAALHVARVHAGEHYAADTRYNLAANGVNAVERPRGTRRRPRRRLAAAIVVLVLAVLAFTITVAAVTSRAAPPAPAIGIVATTITTAATAGPEGYRPAPAGPPATDRNGQWIPTSSSAGGGR